MRRFAIRLVSILFGGSVLAVLTAPALGQQPPARSGQDVDTSFRYNLSPPGARSLAMGGAFLALADDATAAYTNPAGLTNLTVGGSEVAVEARHWRFVNSFVDRGHGLLEDRSPTGIGVDTEAGFQREESGSEVTGLSFVSFAYVMPRGLVLAIYRHEVANFETTFETQGPFYRLARFEDFFAQFGFDELFFIDRVFPQRSRTDLEIVNYGASSAFEFPLDAIDSSLSLGIGASFYQLDFEVTSEFFYPYHFGNAGTLEGVREEGIERNPGFFFGPPDFSNDNLTERDVQVGDDEDVGFNAGFLLKLGRSRRWSIGGVYRQGPVFDTRFTATDFGNVLCQLNQFENPCPLDADGNPILVPPSETFESQGTIHVPDVFGIGVAFRSGGGKTKIALDLNRVRYSQQLEDFVPRTDEGTLLPGFNIDDADQVHLGFERIVLVVESLFVGTARFGIWNEPFHELEFVGSPDADGFPNFFAEFLDRPKDDELHLSLGFGLVIKEDYQIDLAADVSEVGDTFSLSLVKFF